jgi:diguanylate cyclase (GGDEF)-like protein
MRRVDPTFVQAAIRHTGKLPIRAIGTPFSMPPSPFPHGSVAPVTGTRRRLVVAVAAWLVVVAASCVVLAHTQAQARQGVDQRFALRATLASRFVTTYVRDLIARQTGQAVRHLSSRTVSRREFERTAEDGGFGAAVLLDGRGRMLHVLPAKRSLVGQDLAVRYDHLREALQGRPTVSKIVRSAARGLPVVAVAVPFPTAYGRRVYSGAYALSETPVGSYLRNAIATPQSRVLLLDPAGVVIASNAAHSAGPVALRQLDPALARAMESGQQGSFDVRGSAQHFVSTAIEGTPWRMVIVLPAKRLYVSVGGATFWVPWLALVAFAAVSLVAVLLFLRNATDRRRLAGLNDELERLVGVDALTGLSNRRQIECDLVRVVSAARRHDTELSVLLIDIDHFKDVNDTHGHQTGDRALVAVARALERALRREDLVGRWGGEEFIAILPGTDEDGAAVVAERIRAGVVELEVLTDESLAIHLTASVGVAEGARNGANELVQRADGALYAAKAAGRNRVEVAAAEASRFTPA